MTGRVCLILALGCNGKDGDGVSPGPDPDGGPETTTSPDGDPTDDPTPEDTGEAPAVEVVEPCDVVHLDEAIVVPSVAPGARFGAALAGGDFDGDGIDELAVGAPLANAVRIYALVADVLVAETTLTGSVPAHFGEALVTGDFDADGFDDLVVGGPDDAGVWLYPAADPYAVVRLDAGSFGCGLSHTTDRFGATLAAGDLNQDGFVDLIVGAPGADNGAGMVCVGLGGAGGLLPGGPFRQSDGGNGLDEGGDAYGASLAAADFDGDGFVDVAVGAPGEGVGAGPERAGVVYVLRGSAGPEPLEGDGYVQEEDAIGTSEIDDAFGSVMAAGDIDGDGFADLVVGVPEEEIGPVSSGAVYLLFGSLSGLGAGFSVDLEESGGANEDGDQLGATLAVADFDADGWADWVVSSPGSDAFHVYRGRPEDLGWGQLRNGAELGVDPSLSAAIVAAVGDLDGDGAIDLALGSPDAIDGGEVSVVRGRPQPHGCLTHGPGVGAPGPNGAQIWARADREGDCTVRYKRQGVDEPFAFSAPSRFAPENDYVCGVVLEGLAPDSVYDYDVLWDDVWIAGASLLTAPPPGVAPLRFAVGADILISNKPLTAFDTIAADAPSFLMLIGDQIYSDIPTAIENDSVAYDKLYKRTFLDAPFHDFLRTVPLLMMWDDHEITNDYSPGAAAVDRYPTGFQAFEAYQSPFDPPSPTDGALYFTFESGDASFFVLDSRSYRSDNHALDGPDKTMIGEEQKAALFAFLLSSQARFKFVVSPTPFHPFTTTADDSWNGFATERAEIFDFLVDEGIEGVVLVSGDQHWSGVFQLDTGAPYGLYEFMPTPLAIGNRALPADTSSPEILFTDGTHQVYGLFDVDGTTSPATLIFTMRDAATGAALYTLALDETQLGPQ